MELRNKALFFVSITASIGLLASMVVSIEWRTFASTLATLSVPVIGASMALYVLSIYAATWRYALILRPLAVRRLSVASLLPVNYLAVALSLVAPVSAAGDATRLFHAWRSLGFSIDMALMATFLDRLAGIIAIVALGILFIPFHWNAGVSAGLIWLEFVTLGGGIVVVSLFAGMQRSSILRSWRIVAWGVSLFEGLRRLYSTARATGLQLLIAAIIIGTQGLMLWLLARDMGYEHSGLLLLSLVPLVMLVQNVPFLYAGWGAREAILVVALSGPEGLPAEAALALSVTIGLIRTIASAPGLLFLTTLRPSARAQAEISQWPRP